MQKKQKIIIVFLSFVACVLVARWLLNINQVSTDDATIEAHVIPISAKIPGHISALYVQDNQYVKQGTVLAEIEPRDYHLKRDAIRANLISVEVSAQNAAVNAKRQITIGKTAATQKDIDDAIATKRTTQAAVDNVQAQLAIAEQDLIDTKILAPQNGVITKRTAEQGAYMNTGQTLFFLVGDERWVIANFKEVQITRMKPGQKVTLTVDAYPGLSLKGHVDSIQSGTGARFSVFPAENATGNFVKVVQRVPVKIVFDTPLPEGVVLGPGFSVYPTVYLE